MMRPKRTIVLGSALVLIFVTVVGGLGAAGTAAPAPASGATSFVTHNWTKLPSAVLVSAPPAGATGPDDLAYLSTPSLDWGRPLVWTAYQNGINPNGTPGSPNGTQNSTLAGYDPALGVLVKSIPILGKVDGLTADKSMGRLIATVNEDDNSALRVIDPGTGNVTNYTYSPNPAVSGNGGTDSVSIWNGHIYTTHSNPNDTTQAAEYLVTLNQTSHIAALTTVFSDNSLATDLKSNKTIHLALTDPDTNAVMPSTSPRFAGELATISQGDGRVIFAKASGAHVRLHQLNLTDNVTHNVPPIDGFAVTTTSSGILYVVDASANTITALSTAGFPAGTVFVGEPHDNGNPLIGTLNVSTGHVTPLGNAFASPKGLLWEPGTHLPTAAAHLSATAAAHLGALAAVHDREMRMRA